MLGDQLALERRKRFSVGEKRGRVSGRNFSTSIDLPLVAAEGYGVVLARCDAASLVTEFAHR